MGTNDVIVGMADLKTGEAPSVLRTNLGSCIAVCLYEPTTKKGGLIHFMLANAPSKLEPNLKKAKYADTGIVELIAQLSKLVPGHKSNICAKVFGGAKVLPGTMHNIGSDNEIAAKEILKSAGIKITAQKTGGEKGYKVAFDLSTGKVKVQVFGAQEEEF